MLKLKNTDGEYEVTGSIEIDVDGEIRTNYTVVIDDETLTIQLPHQDWEVIEVPDPVPEVVVEVVEEPVAEPEPAPEELAAHQAMLDAAAAKQEFISKLEEWDAKRIAGKFIEAYGGQVSPEDGQKFVELTTWLLQNMKPEYAVEAKPYLSNLI